MEPQVSLASKATKVTRVHLAILERAVVLVLKAHKVLQESPVRVARHATVELAVNHILSVIRRKLPLKSVKSHLILRRKSGRTLKKHALSVSKSVQRKRKRERRKQKKISASEKKSIRRKKKRRQKRKKRRISLRPKRKLKKLRQSSRPRRKLKKKPQKLKQKRKQKRQQQNLKLRRRHKRLQQN